MLQARRSNYDTDLFAPLLAATAAATGAPPYAGRVGAADAAFLRRDTAYRVVADHMRALTVALADGAVIGSAGRGYVLRRVLRRAARYGRQTLGGEAGLLTALVPAAVGSLEAAYPGLAEKLPLVQAAVAEEEASFDAVLSRGLREFEARAAAVRANAAAAAAAGGEPAELLLSGADAFYLYDTLGFPLDLTKLMARETGLAVDAVGFEVAMAAQRAQARAEAVAIKYVIEAVTVCTCRAGLVTWLSHPMSPGYHPISPGYHPMSPGYHPMSPGHHPMSPGSHP